MVITERLLGSVMIFDLQGRMTADDRGELFASKVKNVVRHGHRMLVLNLEKVSYMDTTCLGEILAARRMLKENSSEFRLMNVPSRIQHVLDVAKLDLLETIDTESIESLQST